MIRGKLLITLLHQNQGICRGFPDVFAGAMSTVTQVAQFKRFISGSGKGFLFLETFIFKS